MIVAGEFGALLEIEILPVTFPAVVGAKVAANVTLAPGLIDCAPNPLKPKPAPEALAPVIFTTAFPELVRVMFCDEFPPTAILPNGTFVGLIVKPGCDCVPVPLSAIASGEFGASLAIEMLPVAAPAAVGANFTVKEVLCPPFNVVAESPLMLKPAPDGEPDEIAMLPVPVLVRVTDTNELLPTAKLPKLTAVGFAARCGWVPTPTRLTFKIGFDALLVIVTAPAALPAAAGANFAVKVVVWPAFKVIGPSPVMLKPVPDAAACEIAIGLAPEFVSVTDWLPLVPTVTFPKETLPGVARRAALSAVPVPPSSRLCIEFGALSINLMLPVAPCGAAGANFTLKDTFFDAAIVTGTVRPLIPNPAPEI